MFRKKYVVFIKIDVANENEHKHKYNLLLKWFTRVDCISLGLVIM